ncbi:hypothetical protein RRG08_012863 [Elysia crispata]|uniref:Uncharacterized protein n=1 Tax=Elysia crispata TaxID=231223 RepID=A0AAE0Y7V2_9GAST|nr:hypothetical protein RRG08_012863 [Elysia crispata]
MVRSGAVWCSSLLSRVAHCATRPVGRGHDGIFVLLFRYDIAMVRCFMGAGGGTNCEFLKREGFRESRGKRGGRGEGTCVCPLGENDLSRKKML